MNIEHIYIGSFGKFQDFELDLGSGLNVIYGNNEDGKSTIMAFVRMMFYGDSSRSQNIREKPRTLYRPWHSDRMLGTITFTAAGSRYQLDRVFGKTNSADKIKITNVDTGTDVPLARNEEPGERFLDLGLEAFEKSVFIGQNNSMISGSGKEDEIMQKLLNLVTTGDENTSYKRVSANIDAARYELQSKRGNKGLLPDAVNRLEELQAERERALIDEQDKVDTRAEITRLQTEKTVLMADREKLRSQLSLSRLETERQQLEHKIRLRSELAKLLAKQNRINQELERDEVVLDSAFVEEAERKITAHANIKSSLQQAAEQKEEADARLAELMGEDVQEIPDGKTERLRKLEREAEETDHKIGLITNKIGRLEELAQIEQELEELQKELQVKQNELKKTQETEKELQNQQNELANRKKDKLAKQKSLREQLAEADQARNAAVLRLNNASNQVKSLQDKYAVKQEMVEDQLARARKPQKYQEQIPASREVRKPLAAAGAALALLAIVLGILVEPLLFLVIIAAAVILIFSVHKVPARTITREIADDQLASQLEQNLSRIKEEKNAEITTAESEVERAQEISEEAEQAYKRATEDLNRFEQELAGLEQELSAIDELHDQKKDEATLAQAACEELGRRIESRSKLIRDKRETIDGIGAVRSGALQSDDNDTEKQQENIKSEDTTETLLAEARKHEIELKDLHQKLEQTVHDELAEFDAADSDELYGLEKVWTTHAEQLKSRTSLCDGFAERVKTLSDQLSQAEQDLLAFVSAYKPAGTYEQCLINLNELEQQLKVLAGLSSEIKGYRNSLEGADEVAVEELEKQYGSLSARIDELQKQHTAVPEGSSPDQLNADIGKIDQEITEISHAIASQEATVREKYRKRRNVSQIDDDIERLTAKIESMKKDQDILDLAVSIMEDSFQEVQRSFGPMVNQKTAEIFEQLTQGKYRNVMVSRDFAITFENSGDRMLKEWGYLSSGTIDQVYLALRLAITDLVSKDGEPLPLLLDDVFTLYDDTRAYEGMQFISTYRQNEDSPQQAVLFTCHRRIATWGDQLGAHAVDLT